MARHKDVNWIIPEEDTWHSAKLAVLMDIRDELKQLNRRLSCGGFLNIPLKLEQIARNTTKKKPKFKVVKKKEAA